jgi:ankyrin repeat protein
MFLHKHVLQAAALSVAIATGIASPRAIAAPTDPQLTANTGAPAAVGGQQLDTTPAHLKELFFAAAREGRIDLLDGLIKAGLNPEARDPRGYTALILAAYNEHPAAVDFLIGKGDNACAADPKGNTSLMGVAFKGNAQIAARLIAAHCNVNAVNGAGQTALMMASMFGRNDVAQLLLTHGADPQIHDAAGNTARGLAVQQGNQPLLALLDARRVQ